jgi:hypothetical protein
MTLGIRARCHFVPPYLMRRLGRLADAEVDDELRTARARADHLAVRATSIAGPSWTVHTAEQTRQLPGRPVRAAGEPVSGDEAVDEAATGISGSLALFEEVYGRSSYDGQGAPVSLTVHYGRDYPNAFWDGTQLVFGDGDREVFDRFTRSVDVLAHELTHAVTERTAGLVYADQPGALNESLSDVFASCLKQRLLGQEAADGDWLIGAEIFLPGVQARGLRDLRAPGTAYDDPRLGTDPQPGHLDDYVVGPDDNGGVHINSGIPNRAFHLAAVGIGGTSWDGAGRIWYDALVGGDVGPDTDFTGFAAATVVAAGPHAETVTRAWADVGVLLDDSQAASGGAAGPAPSHVGGRTVRVQRSGGFAGRVSEASVDLDEVALRPDGELADLPRLVARVRQQGDLAAGKPANPMPDMFLYDLDLCGSRARLPEHQLSDDLRRIVDLVLRSGQ